MTGRARLGAILAGAAAGASGGMFGVGGGVILVPLLSGPLGLTQHQATGTSLAVVVFTAVATVAIYASHGNVAWVVGALLAASSVTTAPWGAKLGQRTSGRALARWFVVFMVVVAIRLLWKPPIESNVAMSAVTNVLAGVLIGGVAGVLAGFLGVGGGMVMVPALTLLFGMSQQLAQGTSLLAIVGSGISGALAHRRQGTLVGRFVPWLGLGALIGAPLASWWAQGLPHVLLVRAFAAFLLVMSVVVWVRADARESAGRSRPTP